MKKHLRLRLLILSAISAALLAIPYIIPHAGIVIFVALMPLFTAEYIASTNGVKRFWPFAFASFFIWNIAATYWIYLATLPGAIAAIILNSLQMTFIFGLFRFVKKRFKGILPYFMFAFMWVAWESLYYTWQISWPWLTLGNAFATSIKNIQWYSLTGVMGGSLWALCINILLFFTIVRLTQKKSKRSILKFCYALAILIVVPITYSYIRYYTYPTSKDGSAAKEVVIAQPNIDPYNDKFGRLSQADQNEILFNLVKKSLTPKTYLVLAPETFFNPSFANGNIEESAPQLNRTFLQFRELAVNNNVNAVFGAVTYYLYPTESSAAPSPTAREYAYNHWFEAYNTAIFLNNNGLHEFYHKSKLVILAETTPILFGKNIFKFLGIDLGGQIGSFAKQKERSVFGGGSGALFGTAICYESVYGDFYRDYVRKGAQFMTIITNDGWWGNTFGHKQHLHYASLRAIETRRDIARCANTGISAFINQRGDIVSQTPWWEATTLRGEVRLNDSLTPFVKYGDVTGYASTVITILLLLVAAFKKRLTV